MKIVALVCRILLGLAFVIFGLNGFLHFIPMGPAPAPGSAEASFFAAMVPTGWMSFQFALQLLGGVLVLIGGTLPLGLCLLCPITVNILCFHTLLLGGKGILPALIVTVLELVLIYAYRTNFAGILTARARPVV